jgi:hypothetical protein
MLKNSLVLLALLLLLGGCGMKQTNRQYQDMGYLKFNKSISDSFSVVVDNNYKFKLDACVEHKKIENSQYQCTKNSSSETLFNVGSGSHMVEIFDENSKKIFSQDIYVGLNNTVEIGL